MAPSAQMGLLGIVAVSLLIITQSAVSVAAPKKPRRIATARAHEVYNKAGTKRLTALEGNNWKDTLTRIAKQAQEPVLITGITLQKRGGFKVYNGNLLAGETCASDFGGAGKNYNGLTGTIEVRAIRTKDTAKVIPRAGWVGYPYEQKAPLQGELTEKPTPDPSALLIYFGDNAQASAWSFAPRCDNPHDNPPRINELHRALMAQPNLFKRVIQACNDKHAVAKLLKSNLKISDATSHEIETYSRALRRIIDRNGGVDPYGFSIKPDPAPKFATPPTAYPELEKDLQQPYLSTTPLPSTYSKILAALHKYRISDIQPVLKWLAQRPATEWTDTGFIDAIRKTWEPSPKNAEPYLVHQLQTGSKKSAGLHGENFARLQSESFDSQKLLSELPLLVYFAQRAKRGEIPSAQLFARALTAQRNAHKKVQILQAAETVPDKYVDSLFHIRRPIEGLRIAIDLADQPAAAVVALTEPSLPDTMSFDLSKRRWAKRDDAVAVVNELSANQRAQQLIETVSYFVDYGQIPRDALATFHVAGKTIPLVEHKLTAAIRENPAVEFELTRTFWQALHTHYNGMIDTVEFDRLSKRIPIHQLHKKKQLLLWILNRKYALNRPYEPTSEETPAKKISNRVFESALLSSKSDESLIEIISAFASTPIVGQKALRAAINAKLKAKQLIGLAHQAYKRNMSDTELTSLLLEPLPDATALLRYLNGLDKTQRATTIENYHHSRLTWSDVSILAKNTNAETLSKLKLAHILANRMQPELLEPVQAVVREARDCGLSPSIDNAVQNYEPFARVFGALSTDEARNTSVAKRNEFASTSAQRIEARQESQEAEQPAAQKVTPGNFKPREPIAADFTKTTLEPFRSVLVKVASGKYPFAVQHLATLPIELWQASLPQLEQAVVNVLRTAAVKRPLSNARLIAEQIGDRLAQLDGTAGWNTFARLVQQDLSTPPLENVHRYLDACVPQSDWRELADAVTTLACAPHQGIIKHTDAYQLKSTIPEELLALSHKRLVGVFEALTQRQGMVDADNSTRRRLISLLAAKVGSVAPNVAEIEGLECADIVWLNRRHTDAHFNFKAMLIGMLPSHVKHAIQGHIRDTLFNPAAPANPETLPGWLRKLPIAEQQTFIHALTNDTLSSATKSQRKRIHNWIMRRYGLTETTTRDAKLNWDDARWAIHSDPKSFVPFMQYFFKLNAAQIRLSDFQN